LRKQLATEGYLAIFLRCCISGAFDKVEAERLVLKCKAIGVPSNLLRLIRSYLEPRVGHVVVEGALSDAMPMSDMVWQGSVLGPML
jgi:hypothetical protein